MVGAMRAKAPRVIDAEFEIVQGVRERRSAGRRLLGWLRRTAISTLLASAFALVVGWIGLYVLNLRFQELRWLVIAIAVAGAFGRGFLSARR